MNHPPAEQRGITVIPVKTGIPRANKLDSRSIDCGNDDQRKRSLTPKQSFKAELVTGHSLKGYFPLLLRFNFRGNVRCFHPFRRRRCASCDRGRHGAYHEKTGCRSAASVKSTSCFDGLSYLHAFGSSHQSALSPRCPVRTLFPRSPALFCSTSVLSHTDLKRSKQRPCSSGD